MTDTASAPTTSDALEGTSHARLRLGVAVAAATAVSAAAVAGILPILYALPVIGLLFACGARQDNTPVARPLAMSRRNAVLGMLTAILVLVVVLQPQLVLPLASLVGLDLYGLIITLLPIAVLALVLGMDDATSRVDDLPVTRMILTQRNLVLALTVVVTVATWHSGPGLSVLPLAVLVVLLPTVLAISRMRQARRGRVRTGWWRQPLSDDVRPHLVQLLNVGLLCALLGVLVLPGTFDVVRLNLSADVYRWLQIAYVAGLVALIGLALVPLRHVRLASNLMVLAGSVFVAVQLVMIYRPAAEAVIIASPLATPWYVGQGGHAEVVNYHHVTGPQRDALDILQVIDGRTHSEGRSDLESYYIYGEPLLAPADGVVTSLVDGLPDRAAGSVDPDPANQAGNHVVIDVGGGRYVMMGHIRQDSTRVAVGDRVRAGQVIAQVGNSGNTDEPHVHIQALNLPEFDLSADDPVGLLKAIRTYPLIFRDVTLVRDGVSSTPATADPRRADVLTPLP